MSHIDRRPVLCLLLLWAPGVDGPLRYHFHHGRDGQNLPDGGRVDSWSGQAVSKKVPGSLFRSSLCAKSELDWKLGELWNARETLDLQELLKSKKTFLVHASCHLMSIICNCWCGLFAIWIVRRVTWACQLSQNPPEPRHVELCM